MIHSTFAKFALVSLGLAAALAASADVSVDTFGPGDSYNAYSGYVISTSTSGFGANYFNAQQFTSSTTGLVDAITFAAFRYGGTGSIEIGIYSDLSDTVGLQIGSFAVGTVTSASPGIYTFAAPAGIAVAAGQKYWLGMKALDDTAISELFTSPAATGPFSAEYGFGTSSGTSSRSAYRVETQPVPEPASLAALGLGALGLMRRRRKA